MIFSLPPHELSDTSFTNCYIIRIASQTTPLSIALLKDNLSCAELLLSTDVDINFPDDKGATVLMNQLLTNYDESSLEKVRFLVETKGADVKIKDMTGTTAVCSSFLCLPVCTK